MAAVKRAGGLLLVVVCLGVFAWAGLRANAAWHFIAAQSIAEPLFETGGGSELIFEASESRVNTALRRFPGNPDYLDFSGRLMTLKASQPGVMGREKRELLESAASNFRKALSIRPLWPYSWVNLLGAKEALGVVDAEFRLALARSIATGPWEPRVQLQVLNSGLRRWGKLGVHERGLVLETLSDALKTQPREAFEIIRSYGRTDLVCEDTAVHIPIARWCQSLLPRD